MTGRVLLLLGTRKGAYVLEADAAGRGAPASWTVRGPLFEPWPINVFRHDPETGVLYAGGGNPWYGAAVWRSADLGETWSHSSAGLTYGEGGPAIRAVWQLTPAHGALFAGVEPAGLFRTDDGGETWRHVEGLTRHPTRPTWQPGAGGLICHTVLADPDDAARMWVAISAVGCFATADGGGTWEARNRGVRADFMPDHYPETGQCVHKMVLAPGVRDRLYQQNHCGTYRSDDGGRTWICLDEGLPSTFGFPVVAHPRDPDTIYTIPLNGADRGRVMPEGKAAVWRTTDAGRSWTALRDGLPQSNAFVGVLRDAMATDPLEPFGIYFGTSTGQVYASANEGRTWARIADLLPPIHSVATAVITA